jgi:Flp pilus assembly CpaF family ATPase
MTLNYLSRTISRLKIVVTRSTYREIELRPLVKEGLRMRPSRIIVSDVRQRYKPGLVERAEPRP